MRVDIWSDVICPFCYVGEKRLEHVAAEMGIELEIFWHSYQLEPDAPSRHSTPNIEMIAAKYRCSLDKAYEHQRNVQALCATEGVGFNWEAVQPGNTHYAHLIIQKAQTKGVGTAAVEAFFEAYMNQGLAIGEESVARDVGISIGLSHAEVEEAITSPKYAALVEWDQSTARKLKITGVPFFLIENVVAVSGAQAPERFEAALNAARLHRIKRLKPEGMVCDGDSCEIPS